MHTPLPRLAWPLGLAGLLPFAGGVVAAALGEGWAAGAVVAYGATILAFLGAVHWGLALATPPIGQDWRLVGGVIPALVAWVALLSPLPIAFGLLAAGLLSLTAVETQAARVGLLPWSYLRLRWALSTLAAASLISTAYLT